MQSVEEKLLALGLEMPVVTPSANLFVGFKVAGDLVFISGQLPMKDGKPTHLGKLGSEVSIEDAVLAARQCALNVLAQLKQAVNGDWSRVVQTVRVGGFVNSAPTFYEAPAVINGASKLFIDALGEAGKHARAAVGVATLPANAAVEVDAIFQIRS
jgi:enamine deaminase RidA (YjgF/YER057c/UK114 family)